MHSSDTLNPPESHQSGQDHDSGRRDRSSTSSKHPRRRFLLGGAAVLGLAATGTSAWALNRPGGQGAEGGRLLGDPGHERDGRGQLLLLVQHEHPD